MPSPEPSPRPWLAIYARVLDAEGKTVCVCAKDSMHGRADDETTKADAALIVSAVNQLAKFEEARMEFPDFRPVIIAAGQRDAAIAERDRLRDIVRRLSRHLANYITSESENDLLREARAAIGEETK